jgi:hypothetical protein
MECPFAAGARPTNETGGRDGAADDQQDQEKGNWTGCTSLSFMRVPRIFRRVHTHLSQPSRLENSFDGATNVYGGTGRVDS